VMILGCIFPQPEDEVIFCRAVEMKNWSETMAPKDKTGICLDFSSNSDEKFWDSKNDAEIIARVKEGLLKTDIIKDVKEVEEAMVLRVPYTYPIYDLSYSDNLKPVISHLEKTGQLRLLGRTGKFSYTNMDDNVKDGFKLAEEIVN